MSELKLSPEELEAMLDRSAKRALDSIGLTDENAARDIQEMRSLLDAWRDTRKSIWNTTVRILTVATLTFIAGAVWMTFNGEQLVRKTLVYGGWAIFIIVIWLMAKEVMAEGCDSTTNSNCIETNSNTNSTVNSNLKSETTVKSPPPSAMSPSINMSNSDLCTVGVSGAVQTQILGISAGATVRDMNCERLKNAKVLYDMGMKVAAVSVMCQDKRIFDSMMNAGTPCPYDGLVGKPAKEAWNNNAHLIPGAKTGKKEEWDDDTKSTATGAGAIGGLLLALLFIL